MHILDSTMAGTADEFRWSSLIDRLGSPDFSAAVAEELDRWARVEYCAGFALGSDSIQLVTSGSVRNPQVARSMAAMYVSGLWRSDPTIVCARRAPHRGDVAVRMSPSEFPDAEIRQVIYLDQQICDRVFLCGRRDEQWYAYSVLRTRTRGCFEDESIDRLRALSGPLLSLLAMHHRIGVAVDAPVTLLRSVPDIEIRLRELAPTLSRRESQVCARILHGVSTPGIAIELSLREDSVATYRKRAYRRLSIGTRHELMHLYLSRPMNAATPLHH